MAAFYAQPYLLTGAVMATSGQIGVVDTVQQFPIGTVVAGTDVLGGYAEYIYLQGIGSTIVGSVVTYDETGLTALIAANAIGPVAVATALTVAATFGWYARVGTFPVDMVANVADNSNLGRETTNGKVGDGFATGDMIIGMIARAAVTTAAVSNCQLYNPLVNDQSGA